jgi:Transposase DDE domain group 1
VQVSHTFTPQSAVFDEDNLVSCAGLVPVMALAEQAGLSELLANKIHIAAPRVKSGSANPAGKLATLIAGMCAGADYIDDVDLVRAGGMKTLFHRVYAPSTVGTLLREFTFGHARQLDSVLAEHLAGLCERVNLLPGAQARAFIDIDSLVRPVYGHAKQGASYGHTKIAGKQVLRKGLSPLVTTISTDTAPPLVTGIRLRAGKTHSGKGAARMVAQAITTARAAGVSGLITVRGDSAYGCRAVVGTCRRYGAVFSLVLTRNSAVHRAIDAISEDAWTPVQYPGAVRDPDTGAWISCPGRRNHLHHGRIRHRGNHRPPDRAPRQRRQPTRRRPVPDLAVSPVFHQLHRACHRRRYHPPPPRDHRNHLRRSHRRTPGPHSFWTLRRQFRLGDLRGHRA